MKRGVNTDPDYQGAGRAFVCLSWQSLFSDYCSIWFYIINCFFLNTAAGFRMQPLPAASENRIGSLSGGGGCLVKNFYKFSTDRVKFVEDICAAAKGYEYLAETQMKAEAKE